MASQLIRTVQKSIEWPGISSLRGKTDGAVFYQLSYKGMPERSLVSWTPMIFGYVLIEKHGKAWDIF
jgi:hypothetical protein